MTRSTTVVMIAALVAAFVVGALVAGGQNAAVAQEEGQDQQVDIKALTQASPVVAAVPYQSRVEYEQDPFEPTRLKRTTETVTRVMLVKADGTVEIKEAK
ncbi:MAG: hypothetical protein ABFD96_02880 [Armatimonadia bacterium]